MAAKVFVAWISREWLQTTYCWDLFSRAPDGMQMQDKWWNTNILKFACKCIFQIFQPNHFKMVSKVSAYFNFRDADKDQLPSNFTGWKTTTVLKSDWNFTLKQRLMSWVTFGCQGQKSLMNEPV